MEASDLLFKMLLNNLRESLLFLGREFLFSKLREKFSPSPERRLSGVDPLGN